MTGTPTGFLLVLDSGTARAGARALVDLYPRTTLAEMPDEDLRRALGLAGQAAHDIGVFVLRLDLERDRRRKEAPDA